MTMKIKKRMQKDGRNYVLVSGIRKKTLINDIAKKYSKNYKLTAFGNISEKGELLLLKRKTPLRKRVETWYKWEHK